MKSYHAASWARTPVWATHGWLRSHAQVSRTRMTTDSSFQTPKKGNAIFAMFDRRWRKNAGSCSWWLQLCLLARQFSIGSLYTARQSYCCSRTTTTKSALPSPVVAQFERVSDVKPPAYCTPLIDQLMGSVGLCAGQQNGLPRDTWRLGRLFESSEASSLCVQVFYNGQSPLVRGQSRGQHIITFCGQVK